MKNFNLEYKNHQFSYERIKEKRTELNSKLFQINKDYCCKISGNPQNKIITDLNKSILMRIDSVLFHYELLSDINIAGQQIESEYRGVNLTSGYLKTIQQERATTTFNTYTADKTKMPCLNTFKRSN